jgi:hypothetical protein
MARRAIGLVVAVFALLGLAPAAGAATISSSGGVITYSGDGAADKIVVNTEPADYHFVPDAGNDATLTPGGGCSDDGASGVTCPSAVVSSVVIETGDGSDQVSVAEPSPPDPFVMRMGAGVDAVYAGAERDEIDGGADEDLIDPGGGADEIDGGDSSDLVDYASRSGSVTVTFDDQPNDGEAGEGDNVHSNVEGAVGGAGSDVLIGDAGGNLLEGGGGNDRLIGGGTADRLHGGAGDDSIDAGDSEPDDVECGAGDDEATIDGTDSVVDCERLTNVDADGDSSRVGVDCNDNNRDIHPGAVDHPENGIDENCDGRDEGNFDRDGDGIPRPQDCNDANPSINPGRLEIPGNDVDENCDGVAAPFPTVGATISADWQYSRRFTRNRRIVVKGVPSGGRVTVSCRGKGCPSRMPRVRVRRNRATITALRGRKLRVGAVVEVRVTASQMTGKVKRYTIRRGRLPSASELCLPPGARRTTPCP